MMRIFRLAVPLLSKSFDCRLPTTHFGCRTLFQIDSAEPSLQHLHSQPLDLEVGLTPSIARGSAVQQVFCQPMQKFHELVR